MIELSGNDVYKILNDDSFIFLYFTASWCGPCKLLLPKIEELEKKLNENKNKIIFCKIDVDDNNDDICKRCDIKNVPTIIIFKDRKALGKVIGLNFENILKLIKDNCIL